MGEPDPIVKREIKRQTVVLLFSLAGALITVYVMRKMNEPDFGRTLKMSAALKVKHFASAQVDWWQGVADRASTIYNREKA